MAFGLLGAFLAGCLATQLAPLVIPPARAGTSPQKWEYACMASPYDAKATDDAAKANEFGQSGWEMIGALAHYGGGGDWCFKRSLP